MQKEKLAGVRLPEIKRRKEGLNIDQPKPKGKNLEEKDYYSYKSPNFKQYEQNNVNSMQVESFDHFREAHSDKNKINSFEQ